MLDIETAETPVLMVKDLKEGDIAVIKYGDESILVYIFKQDSPRGLSMVALNMEKSFWSSTKENRIEVSQVLSSGTYLKVR